MREKNEQERAKGRRVGLRGIEGKGTYGGKDGGGGMCGVREEEEEEGGREPGREGDVGEVSR